MDHQVSIFDTLYGRGGESNRGSDTLKRGAGADVGVGCSDIYLWCERNGERIEGK